MKLALSDSVVSSNRLSAFAGLKMVIYRLTVALNNRGLRKGWMVFLLAPILGRLREPRIVGNSRA